MVKLFHIEKSVKVSKKIVNAMLILTVDNERLIVSKKELQVQ